MSKVNQASIESQEKLVSDIKSVITDAEEMLSATADQAGDKISQLRARVKARLGDARERLIDAEAALIHKTKAAARATDDYVHESPWTAVGVAATVGLLVGLIIGRR
ncbi:ElaB/YqjD/DUF883 family membrane-anchored ribosome-binding protein [Rhodoferax ferrireducens]|uniref:ElaB/YqjD/DUF883 family membrane-anchored ribosome-binding protein n=1 Tax=Rhodoferax ferrireducens TaxID=192843 RepID=A0ABU2CAZ0_9BURK|nr:MULTISPECIES: DUF883 family protein [Rhodoferax]MDR7378481.1 ElaB/YqjD/DUF883 family membrane-anchored ribosome-binding protein [Rhodoferax ferrireducens]SDO82668.1 Membrane-anchored ribosome-binding protein, inhibits growth in stationary phase, ElaB/YqjD/DUF883 family [Rhodoferax sp. OV413]